MQSQHQIIILGGTGRAGREIAALLLEHTPVAVVLAGRSRELYTRKDTRMSEQEPHNHPASDQEPHNHPAAPFIGIGIAIGAGVGTAVGVALGNIALGVGIGIGLGVALGALWGLRKQRKHDDS